VEALIILILVILTGRYFFHPILHRIAQTKIPEVFTASAILIVLGVSLVAEHINLSMAMGAFMAGMLMSDSSYKHQVVSEIKPFRGLLLGLFFMSMGMSLNLNLLFEKPWLTLGLVLSLVILKVVILFPLVCLFGLEKRKSFAVSIILAQSGEFGLVLFAMASESEIITAAVHQQLLLVILISLLITPVLSNWANSILAKNKSDDDVPVEKVPKSAIVIAGFGRVGHRIGEILNQAGQSFVGIDVDAAIVDQARSDGLPVFYGDVCNQSLLDSIGAKEASVIIITLDDLEATKLIVSTLRAANPTLSIYVRGHNSAECIELQTLGATEVVSENIEASLELARMGLSAINVDDQERERVLQNYARRYYEQIKRAIK
ncbi:MAG TPA: potassium transporter KefC, partial [Methylococcaceae bacterium]|nr:potassium transporter KefC [Methylococcaceae bacterium]